MNAGEFFGLVAVLATLVAIFGIAAGTYRRHLAFQQRKLEIAAGEASGHAAHQAAATSELEKRVRVLERIATEQGLGASDLAFQIEALREAREVTAR